MIDDQITVVIPTSPIPSHPSTAIIDPVIKSIRFHLPTAKIIIMADGIREDLKHRTNQYTGYIQSLAADLALRKYGNTMMPIAMKHTQQAGMLRNMLSSLIDTPLTMFVEHDTPLVTNSNPRDEEGTGRTDHPEDCIINWQDISDIIQSGGLNVVRFYLWEKIWHEHQHLMRGQMIQGESRFIQTVQYSGWPHVASTSFYKKVLREQIPVDKKVMLETALYGPVNASPWEDYRVGIYYPGQNNRRFTHLNGRWDETTGKRDPAEW